MMLYCFTGSDKVSQDNLKKTIYNKIQLNKYAEYLTDKEKADLKSLGLTDGCHMWGAEPGPSNGSRWEKVKIGDRIMGYSQKKFICYGPILYKIHNRELAEAIWGITKKILLGNILIYLENLSI